MILLAPISTPLHTRFMKKPYADDVNELEFVDTIQAASRLVYFDFTPR